MSFSWLEIWGGVVSAAVYGAFFAILLCLFNTGVFVIRDMLKAFRSVFFYDGNIFCVSDLRVSFRDSAHFVDGEIMRLFLVILYSIGFCVSAFLGLDGEVRIYNLVISVCSCITVKRLFSISVERIAFAVFSIFWRILVPALRLALYPLRAIVRFVLKKLKKTPAL